MKKKIHIQLYASPCGKLLLGAINGTPLQGRKTGNNSSFTGFAGGITAKHFLLELE